MNTKSAPDAKSRWVIAIECVGVLCYALGFLAVGTYGSGTRFGLALPGLFGLGVASGVFAVAASFRRAGIKGAGPALFSMVAVTGYFGWRAWSSDVSYLGSADLVLIACVGSCYVGAYYCSSGRLRYVIYGTIAVLAVANVGIGAYQFIWNKPEFWPFGFAGYTRIIDERAAGGFYNSGNHYAGFLEMVGHAQLGLGGRRIQMAGSRTVAIWAMRVRGRNFDEQVWLLGLHGWNGSRAVSRGVCECQAHQVEKGARCGIDLRWNCSVCGYAGLRLAGSLGTLRERTFGELEREGADVAVGDRAVSYCSWHRYGRTVIRIL